MNDQERISKIEDLNDQINPLNHRRILLEAELYFKEKQQDRDEQEIKKIKEDINELLDQLRPLFKQLREVQCHYQIEFQGELINSDNSTYWNTPETEIFYLRKCCQVNTYTNTWAPYINDSCVNNLLLEVHQVIFNWKYLNFKILNIKKL